MIIFIQAQKSSRPFCVRSQDVGYFAGEDWKAAQREFWGRGNIVS
jgi:hypothetical protein